MAIRLPLKTVVSSDNSTEVGAGSVGGIVAIPVTIPQDTDNVVVKFQASVAGGGVSAIFQTTDDGGNSWYDVQRTSIITNGVGENAEFLSISVESNGIRINNVSSSVMSTIKKASSGASTLGACQFSGMPLLSQQARVALVLPAAITAAASNSLVTEVKVNSQSATA